MRYLCKQPNGLYAFYDDVEGKFAWHGATEPRARQILVSSGWSPEDVPRMVREAVEDLDLADPSDPPGRGCDRWMAAWTLYRHAPKSSDGDYLWLLREMVTPVPAEARPHCVTSADVRQFMAIEAGMRLRVALTKQGQRIGESNGTVMAWFDDKDQGVIQLDATGNEHTFARSVILGLATGPPAMHKTPPPSSDFRREALAELREQASDPFRSIRGVNPLRPIRPGRRPKRPRGI